MKSIYIDPMLTSIPIDSLFGGLVRILAGTERQLDAAAYD
jgi:hypothetical protein